MADRTATTLFVTLEIVLFVFIGSSTVTKQPNSNNALIYEGGIGVY